jgi:ABC-type ATPase with predicted acetyltransferase domain
MQQQDFLEAVSRGDIGVISFKKNADLSALLPYDSSFRLLLETTQQELYVTLSHNEVAVDIHQFISSYGVVNSQIRLPIKKFEIFVNLVAPCVLLNYLQQP